MILNRKFYFLTIYVFISNYNNCQCDFLEFLFGPNLNNQQQSGQSNNCSQQIPAKLANNFGYPLETHRVSSKSGHIIILHRIPEGRKGHQRTKRKRVVCINHGLLGSSDMWMIRGPEEDLPYLLADDGYDVWLFNLRGNFYSRYHEYLDPDTDADFWNFGIDEVIEDLPLSIDYILNATNEKNLIFIGHSLGTSTLLILCSTQPEYNDKIKLLLALAPLAVIKHDLNPIHRLIFETANIVLPMLENRGIYEILPRRYEFAQTLDILSRVLTDRFSANLVTMVMGGDPNHVNLTELRRFFPYYPSGTSVKLLQNIFRFFLTKKFAPLNQTEQYDLSKVTLPVSLHYAYGDALINKQDIDELAKRLPNVYGKFPVFDKNFNHLDFVVAINARNVLYNQLLTIINNYN